MRVRVRASEAALLPNGNPEVQVGENGVGNLGRRVESEVQEQK